MCLCAAFPIRCAATRLDSTRRDAIRREANVKHADADAEADAKRRTTQRLHRRRPPARNFSFRSSDAMLKAAVRTRAGTEGRGEKGAGGEPSRYAHSAPNMAQRSAARRRGEESREIPCRMCNP